MYGSVHVLVVSVLISIVFGDDTDNDAKLRYYYGTFDNYTELSLDNADQIFNLSWYNDTRSTVIFAHGFTGRPTGRAVAAVINSYLEQGDANVVFLNWEHLAAASQPTLPNSYVNWAAPNARKLGVRFASALLSLSAAGLPLNTTHLVGHSLGAHICGIAGNTLLEKGILLPWITGLDPAGIGFEGRPLPTRLHAGSARFVDVIHSDPNKYGYSRRMGTVDFWPNFKNIGPIRQPGCGNGPKPMFSTEDLCSHNRCWELLVDSLKHPGTVLGTYAKNYRTWKSYSNKDRRAVVLQIGKLYEKVTPGNYYFLTKAVAPYGLGEEGL